MRSLSSAHDPLFPPNSPYPEPEYPYLRRLVRVDVHRGGYSVIGAIIASRLPEHPIGWICCAIGLIAAVDHFGGEYAVYALLTQPHPLSGARAMLWLQSW